jgi:hypothetical protein
MNNILFYIFVAICTGIPAFLLHIIVHEFGHFITYKMFCPTGRVDILFSLSSTPVALLLGDISTLTPIHHIIINGTAILMNLLLAVGGLLLASKYTDNIFVCISGIMLFSLGVYLVIINSIPLHVESLFNDGYTIMYYVKILIGGN